MKESINSISAEISSYRELHENYSLKGNLLMQFEGIDKEGEATWESNIVYFRLRIIDGKWEIETFRTDITKDQNNIPVRYEIYGFYINDKLSVSAAGDVVISPEATKDLEKIFKDVIQKQKHSIDGPESFFNLKEVDGHSRRIGPFHLGKDRYTPNSD